MAQISVRSLSGKTILVDEVSPYDTSSDLQRKIHNACKAENEIWPDEGVRFSIAGRQVCEKEILGEELFDLMAHEGQPLEVNGFLFGGKVHGSLARAGKVRAQTPKVEKQEKKKKKRGRAFRRMQYNKRFVNVAVTGGRRRGPNAQNV